MNQLDALRAFRLVARLRSFAATARELDLAPSIVTRQIGELEAHLGVRLFNRTTRHVSLTVAGESYFEQIDALVRRLDEVDEELKGTSTHPKGELRVAGPLDFLQLQVVPRLARFRQIYPEINFDLVPMGIRSVPDPSADINLMFGGSAFHPGSDMVVRRLAKTSGILCAAPAYLSRHETPMTPMDLQHHELLIASLPDVARQYIFTPRVGSSARAISIELESKSVRSGSPELMASAALAGLGLVGMLSFAAHEQLVSGALVHVLPDWHITSRDVCIVLPGRRHMPARTRALVDFLAASFGDSQSDPWLVPRRAADAARGQPVSMHEP